jgi:hypothetical protein
MNILLFYYIVPVTMKPNFMLQESSKQVEDIIKFLKPEVFFLFSFDIKLFLTLIFFVHIFMIDFCLLQTVFLELCSSRQHILYREKLKVSTL